MRTRSRRPASWPSRPSRSGSSSGKASTWSSSSRRRIHRTRTPYATVDIERLILRVGGDIVDLAKFDEPIPRGRRGHQLVVDAALTPEQAAALAEIATTDAHATIRGTAKLRAGGRSLLKPIDLTAKVVIVNV